MIRFAPAAISALMLVTAMFGLTGCEKTVEAPLKADGVVSHATRATKGNNIMRFKDTPKPEASTHAGEL